MSKPSTKFAEGTTVPVEKTRGEVEEVLRRFGADSFVAGYEGRTAFVAFRARDRFIRLTLELPDPAAPEFTTLATGRLRADNVAREMFEAECRRRWRSLGLLVKAKVAAIQDGIVAFEEEFLSHIVMADGRPLYEHAKEPLEIAYKTGEIPRLLPGPREG